MEKFYLGLDIGTDSVGIACSDERYELLRAKGNDLWAVRLFDEAQDASKRRANRTARRRLARRKQRIGLLQSVFAPFMDDELFFIRLNNSAFYEEDKDERLSSRFSLFADQNYDDATFHKQYHTIFHLRQALIDRKSGDKKDLRLYYLAIHHIIKYRGHFLLDGESVGAVHDVRRLIKEYNDVARDLEFNKLILSEDRADQLKNIALEAKGINEKKRKIGELFDYHTSEVKEVVSLLSGGNAKAYLIFGEDFEERYKPDGSLCFAKLDDETFEAKRDVFEDEHFALLEKIRAIYNFCVFEKVLNGNESVSKAMIAIYDKHNSDLQKLKKFVKDNYPSTVYRQIFRSKDEKYNYANYVEHTHIYGKKIPVKKCKKEEFYKFLNGTLKMYEVKDIDTLKEITDEIADGTFLPKILNADNGLFPHQINGAELDAILDNLCEDYPEFSVKDESGYSPSEKIKKIFTFRIPYYVGPLNASSDHAWIKRKSDGKITPWNFDDLVDKVASNEEFIRRMTNKCTYLRSYDVLPKGSMYYQAFDTLNQINKLTLDGAPIDVELKKEIFRNVYLKNKKVSVNQIKEYLVNSGKCTEAEAKSTIISGFDTQVELKANVSSYVIFKEKLGDLVDERPDIFENIILWHTLNTDKTLVERVILDWYGDIPQIADNIKWIKGLTGFKDFGRLSKELLCELSGGVDEATGEVYTVLNRLFNTNLNFNQLLFSEQYVFSRNIEVENGELDPDVKYDDVADSYASPMVR